MQRLRPLNAILGFNETMLDGLYGELPEDLKKTVRERYDDRIRCLPLVLREAIRLRQGFCGALI